MTKSEELAGFVVRASYEDLSKEARYQLKIRVIDSLGCAIGALEGEPVGYIREHIGEFSRASMCTLIGAGLSSPDYAALYNSALVRYLDFNDSYLAKGETCHPSDNLGAVLAASEYSKRSGKEFLTALAVAYQVQCRLSEVAPVRARGFDHTTQGSFAVACGVSKALGLDVDKTANAIGICGTAFNALRVTRTGALSHWKGLAYPNTAFCCTNATFLAMRGVSGPREVFEGNKGFMDAISGRFEVDWSKENLELVTRTIIKKYNAEIHAQSAIEGALELKKEHGFSAMDIDGIEIDIFDVAYNIIGGGEEGDKTVVRTKEEADHSLHYMVAVALLDGQVMPEQYKPERIQKEDVQGLLRRVVVRPDQRYTSLFPEHHACRVTIRLKDGRVLSKEKLDYEGFFTNPMSWDGIVGKFRRLTEPYIDGELSKNIVDAVEHLEDIWVSDLTDLLRRVEVPGQRQ
ncbi:MAG: 2-methylcitrate dehydratase [Deltaproteobacteria bacterium]|jgi:2-methylcitrate dehydratase|nr:MAG: 2-methylcitrate dehydratase [Deltaproteobacteria bacterium]